jgi:hypothetical protein
MSHTGSGSSTAQDTGARKPRNTVDQRVAADRITVALIPKASEDLQSLQDRTGLSKTDLANRAISLYEFIDSELHAGRQLVVRDPNTGQEQIVRLL